MKKLGMILGLAAAVAISACGGGGDDPVLVAPATAVVPVTAAAATAVVSQTFAFPSGVPDLGTTGTTTLAFTSTATTPAFQIASGGNTATGTTQFGSCIFTVTASTFPAGSRLAVGQTITVNPCNISVQTAGQQANGVAATRSASFVLGNAVSSGATITVAVNPGGQLAIGGVSVGTVTLTPVTGASS